MSFVAAQIFLKDRFIFCMLNLLYQKGRENNYLLNTRVHRSYLNVRCSSSPIVGEFWTLDRQIRGTLVLPIISIIFSTKRLREIVDYIGITRELNSTRWIEAKVHLCIKFALNDKNTMQRNLAESCVLHVKSCIFCFDKLEEESLLDNDAVRAYCVDHRAYSEPSSFPPPLHKKIVS